MKNRFKKIISLLIVTSLLLLAAGCKGDDPQPQDPDHVFIDLNEHEGVQKRALELKDHEALPDIEVTKKLKFLSWYPLDETSPTAELFKAKYEIPEIDKGENVITLVNTTYEDRYDALAALVQAGDSPDMIPFEERNFPYGAWKRMYEPIDGVIDLSGSEWDVTRDIIDLFKWGGKNYCAVTELNPSSSMLYYRKSVVQEAGLDDPYDLWQMNDWTWDTFRQMVQDFSETDKKWGISSFYIDESTILSTGIGVISIENGKLQNNMEDSRIERAMDFLQELANNEYRFPYHTLTNFQIGTNQFRSGDVLFWGDGPWCYQEKIRKVAEADNWDEDELGIVPFPRDPIADKYYQRGKQDALMLVAGSQNKDGFKAWTQSAIVAVHDEDMKKQGRDKAKKDFNWTETHLEIMDEIREKTTAVWDFKNGIGEDISGVTWDSPVEQLSKFIITFGESYTVLRGENAGVIKARIVEMNE